MPEFATGGMVGPADPGDGSILAILDNSYVMSAAEVEALGPTGFLKPINDQWPRMDVDVIEQQLVDAVTEAAEKISRAFSLPSIADEVVEILRPQLHDVAVSLAQKLNEES